MTSDTDQLRREFVSFARLPGANVAELCRRFSLSRKTAYKWLKRFAAEGEDGLKDRGRCPKTTPRRTPAEVEKQVIELRQEHPAWGPRKLKRRLEDLGLEATPAVSSFGAILRRHGLIEPTESVAHTAYKRFERAEPNELWQMDFKGHFGLGGGGRCHPLPVLDDHSRFLLGIFACGDEQAKTVRRSLEEIFVRYGLPQQILCDNGSPWGGPGGQWTSLGVWLLRQGIKLAHGRPAHPQTQGKEERLNRTLKAELLARRDLRDLAHAQSEFSQWREIYNTQRPHEALGLAVPASRYRPSPRRYQGALNPLEYGVDDVVKKVKSKGEITFKNSTYFIGQAFVGELIALRATLSEHLLAVYYCHQQLGQIDLREKAQTKHHYVALIRPEKKERK